jgi:glycosyltransferase involved in cell wall biosynthesis
LENKADHQFDVDFMSMFKTFERKFPNHAEVEIVNKFIPELSDIYRACDINFSATHTECWWLPGTEALACGLVNIAPRYGGLLDFCNEDNTLFIEGKVKRVPREHLYWQSSPHLVHFVVDTDDAARKLRKAVEEYDELKVRFAEGARKTATRFTWENVAKQIVNLV